MLGPIDYVVVGFVGNKFNGSILTELAKAVDSGTIRVIDLLFITKDNEGAVTATEVEDHTEELKDVISLFSIDSHAPMLSGDDVDQLATEMDVNTSAGVLVIEHVWAIGLKKAIIEAGGVLIDEGRIRPEVVAAVEEDNAKETN